MRFLLAFAPKPPFLDHFAFSPVSLWLVDHWEFRLSRRPLTSHNSYMIAHSYITRLLFHRIKQNCFCCAGRPLPLSSQLLLAGGAPLQSGVCSFVSLGRGISVKHLRAFVPFITLVAGLAASASAQDRYTNYYSGTFSQIGPTELVDIGFPYVSISIQFVSGNFMSAAVKPPPAPGFIAMSSSSTNFFHIENAPSFSDLLTLFPGGNYLYNLAGGTLGTRTVTHTLPDMATFQGENPSYTEAFWNVRTTLDADNNIIVSWNPFTLFPADSLDQVVFAVRPVPGVFQPAILSQSLPPTQSSFTIPASTLGITRDYIVSLTRSRSAATPVANDPGALGAVQVDKSTTMLIRTGFDQCNGDINHDTIVDDADFSLFIVPYNTFDCFDAAMPSGCEADLNGDGFVDDADFSLFIVVYDNFLCPE